jgi:hypothetical protein
LSLRAETSVPDYHIFIDEWAARSQHQTIAPEDLAEKWKGNKKRGYKLPDFDYVFTKANKRTTKLPRDLELDFEVEYFDGHTNLEIVWS